MGMRIYIYYTDTASRGKKQICKTSQRYAKVYKGLQKYAVRHLYHSHSYSDKGAVTPVQSY